MKLMTLAFGVAAVAFASGQAISAPAELPESIAACIRDNAAKVEQAIPSLTDGVQFLVSNICAREVSEESQRRFAESQRQSRERMRKMCEELAKQPQPPSSGNERSYLSLVCDPAAARIGFVGNEDYEGGGYTIYYAGMTQGGPAAIALASRLLLDLRLARQAREGRH